MLPRLCVAVAGPAIICSLFSPTNARSQAGTFTASVSGIAAVPVGQIEDNRYTVASASVGFSYVPTALADVAIRLDLSGLPGTDRTLAPMFSHASSALFATVGPEFDLPAWTGHVYTVASAGVARIWTATTAPIPDCPDSCPRATGTPGGTDFAWSGGAGFVTPRSSFGMAGDAGLRYYDLGRATYISGSYVAHLRTTFLAPSIGVSWRV
jgi:hypothetical protein